MHGVATGIEAGGKGFRAFDMAVDVFEKNCR
jgi:hypothetical protein